MNKLLRLLTLGELTGFVSGGLIVALLPWAGLLVEQPIWLLVAIVCLSAATGFVVAAVASTQGFSSSVALRRGVIGAAVSSIVAASLFALMARMLPGLLTLFRALLAGWLSVMPAMLAGMIAACFGVVLGRRASDVPAESGSTQPLQWGLRSVVGLVAVMGALAPVRLSVPKPSAPVVVLPQRSKPEPAPWTYVPPSGLESAHALQWRIKDQRSVSDVLSSTVVLSKDDRWLGYVSSRNNTLVLMDLNHPSDSRRIPLPHGFDGITFAPDGKRVLLVSEGDPMEMGVADLSTGQYVSLPQLHPRSMRNGKVAWWSEHEVFMQMGQRGDWLLNLETLAMERAETTDRWKSLGVEQRSKLAPELSALPATNRWAWEPRQIAFTVELPEDVRTSDWEVKGGLCLCLQHPQYDARITFRAIGLDTDDRLLATRDSSKIIRVHRGTATVFYFTIEPCPPLQWKIDSPQLPSVGPDDERIKTALRDGTLAAFVYSPVINPLNNKVVGPVRSVVQGVVSVREWKDQSMTVYATELSGGFNHAVIADLHIKSGGRVERVKLDLPHHWWAELTGAVPGCDNVALIPSREDKTKQFSEARSKEKLEIQAREEAARKQREAEAPKVEPKPAQATPPTNVSQPVDDPIRQFVLNHHRKSEQGDSRALAADYADRVDYFSDGVVTSSHILRDEVQYHESHRVLEEKVQGEIRVNRLSATSFTATYLLYTKSLDLQKGVTKEGLFEENLIIVQTPAGLRIARQRAEKKP
ncbi:MAG: hypothetical protein JNM99_10695 [Verrucomicrobiaceae bacterium]|nr:hypothetical protein [Verrucomicrobiaceae bacterium]